MARLGAGGAGEKNPYKIASNTKSDDPNPFIPGILFPSTHPDSCCLLLYKGAIQTLVSWIAPLCFKGNALSHQTIPPAA
ncbi:MAG: hypothetical protein RID53_13990 [Coleofasciculus sp. B1-GNL1-01]|uniref:hypothetical protein n=1 Tax=Coleofasciculus sp. B1-GNL1-01 TaxID=3068484 RepID=UPI0032F2BB66